MPGNEFVGEARHADALLSLIEQQAEQADASRSIADELIVAIKESDMLRLGTSVELGGKDETMIGIANELRTITPLCTSTAWVLWNHLQLFHHTCALLGHPHTDYLRERVSNADWFCQGAGAGGAMRGGQHHADGEGRRAAQQHQDAQSGRLCCVHELSCISTGLICPERV